MATRASDAMKRLAREWQKLYSSAVISGIAGDPAHQKKGGYHISRQDQPYRDNYSVIRPDDRLGPSDTASAVDMNLGLADMKLVHRRLKAAWDNRADPRRKYLNAFNGWNGEGSAGRYDYFDNDSGISDDSHKWHTHLEVRRRYSTDEKAVDAILSILKGETVEQYLGISENEGEEMKLRLCRVEDETAVWVTNGLSRRWVPNPGILNALVAQFGLNPNEMVLANRKDLEEFAGPIEAASTVPPNYK